MSNVPLPEVDADSLTGGFPSLRRYLTAIYDLLYFRSRQDLTACGLQGGLDEAFEQLS